MPNSKTILTRRSFLLAGGKFLLSCALIGRMHYLQVIRSKHYKKLAENNQIKLEFITPIRGNIFDRFGNQLTKNKQIFKATLRAEDTNNLSSVLNKFISLIKVSNEEKEKIYTNIKRYPRFIPITIKENLTWEEVSIIELNTPDLPGISIQKEHIRHYIYDNIFSHTIGYVHTLSEKDFAEELFLKLPDFKVGKTGIEKLFDKQLRGYPGVREIEVNSRNRSIRTLSSRKSTNGKKITLSLDLKLQQKVNQELSKQNSGSVVIINVKSGEILALKSTPTFNPNIFINGINSKQWQHIKNNPYKALINKATSGQYPPGSTFKIVIALAALENKIISPNDKLLCTGYHKIGSHKFHCWKRYGHGNISIIDAITQSCDVFFYKIAQKLGIKNIILMANKLGLGKTTSLNFPSEKPGLIPSKSWKLSHKKQPWIISDTLLTGIGQGYVLSTPLQLAVMVARLANQKYAIKPTINTNDSAIKLKKLNISKEALSIVFKGMWGSVNAVKGTASNAKLQIPNMEIAGKSGTAQVRRISIQERKTGILRNNQLPWKLRDHSIFVGFAPYNDPKYAISIIIEHGGSGNKTAAPIANELLHFLQTKENNYAHPKNIF